MKAEKTLDTSSSVSNPTSSDAMVVAAASHDAKRSEPVSNPTDILISPVSTSNPFLNYLQKMLSGNGDEKPSACKVYSANGLKTAAIVVGSFSGVPYINIALKFAGENLGGYILAYGIFTSLATVTTWALFDVVDSIFMQTKEEKEICKRKTSTCKEVAYWIALPVLAFSTAFPVSYLIYKYNEESLFYAGVSVFTDTITNTCSLNRSYNQMRMKYPVWCGNKQRQKLESIRWRLVNQLEKSLQILPALPTQKSQKVLAATTNVDGKNVSIDPKELIFNLLEVLSEQLAIEEKNTWWYEGLPTYMVKLISAIFPLSWGYFGVLNTSNLLKLVTDEPFTIWFTSIISSVPYLLLEISLAMLVFSKFYRFIVDKQFGTYHQELAQKHYPKSFLIFCVLGLFTTFSAFGPRAKIASDMESGDFGIACAVFVSIGTVSYKSAAMLELIKNSFEKYAAKYGNAEVKRISQFRLRIRRFITLIAEASPEKLPSLLNSLDYKEIASAVSSIGELKQSLTAKDKKDDKKTSAEGAESDALIRASAAGYVSTSNSNDDEKNERGCCCNRWYTFWDKCWSRRSQPEAVRLDNFESSDAKSEQPRNRLLPDQLQANTMCTVM